MFMQQKQSKSNTIARVNNRDIEIHWSEGLGERANGLRWYLVMVGIALVASVALSPLHRGITGDTLWHIANGRWILSHHRIPLYNPFGWSTGHTPWINIEWGWDVVTALLLLGLGNYGLLIWLGLTLGLMVWAQRKRWAALSISNVAQGDWIFLTIIGVSTFWAWRPQLVSYAMFPVWLWTLEASENDTKRLWWLLPELLLWETFHGGYLLGLMAFVIWIGHRILPGSRSVTRQELGIMTGVTLGVGLVLGITPWGWGGFAHAIWEAHNPVIEAAITEWQSPNFHQLWWVAVFGLPTLAVAVRVWIKPESRNWISRFHWIIWALMVGGTLVAVRNYPFFVEQTAIVGAGIGLWHPMRRAPKFPTWSVAAILLVLGMATAPFARSWLVVRTGVPSTVVSFLKVHPGRVLNGYRIGDGLVYDGIPDSLDGRTDLFVASHQWFQKSINAEHGLYSWPHLHHWLTQNRVRYVLWPMADAGTKEILGRKGVRVLYHSHQMVLLSLQAPSKG